MSFGCPRFGLMQQRLHALSSSYHYFCTSLWSRTTKNPDASIGPLAHPFSRLVTPLSLSLPPNCSLERECLMLGRQAFLDHSVMVPRYFSQLAPPFYSPFLVACTRLYKSLCLSVGRSVGHTFTFLRF